MYDLLMFDFYVTSFCSLLIVCCVTHLCSTSLLNKEYSIPQWWGTFRSILNKAYKSATQAKPYSYSSARLIKILFFIHD